ncbi:uncharacterized protein LOC132932772 [Metopolophium dirhodum]|uniref:uncharacterized protein LOC132932772 n=1 Tax=Metopolophium dirhodum TaxID=44670 RepID=UPI00298FB5CE|nr:uncharacterized protein LOC132932772 [Metopolophium dirhodum]
MIDSVYVHFSRPLNNSKLCDIQSKLGLKKGNMLRVCDTRWVCRYKNCEAMLNNFNAIVKYLENEIDEQSDKDIAQAIGILSSIQKCEFIIFLIILKDVLSIMNILSNSLQSKTATLGKSKNIIESVIKTFETSRTDEEFHNVWKKIVNFADENNINLQIPTMGSKRQRRETQNLHDYVVFVTTGAENEVVDSNTTVEIYWQRVAYMPIIDSIVRHLKYRFSKESLLMASSVESFIKMDFVERCFNDRYSCFKIRNECSKKLHDYHKTGF